MIRINHLTFSYPDHGFQLLIPGFRVATGVCSIVFDPTGNRPKQGDFMAVMQQNIENLATACE